MLWQASLLSSAALRIPSSASRASFCAITALSLTLPASSARLPRPCRPALRAPGAGRRAGPLRRTRPPGRARPGHIGAAYRDAGRGPRDAPLRPPTTGIGPATHVYLIAQLSCGLDGAASAAPRRGDLRIRPLPRGRLPARRGGTRDAGRPPWRMRAAPELPGSRGRPWRQARRGRGAAAPRRVAGRPASMRRHRIMESAAGRARATYAGSAFPSPSPYSLAPGCPITSAPHPTRILSAAARPGRGRHRDL